MLDSDAGTLFGVVIENPLPAHTKYGANHDVMRLILCGRGTDDCKQLRSAN